MLIIRYLLSSIKCDELAEFFSANKVQLSLYNATDFCCRRVEWHILSCTAGLSRSKGRNVRRAVIIWRSWQLPNDGDASRWLLAGAQCSDKWRFIHISIMHRLDRSVGWTDMRDPWTLQSFVLVNSFACCQIRCPSSILIVSAFPL